MISGLFSLPMPLADEPRPEIGARGPQFIVGPENALVRTLAAAMQGESTSFNPLVLCGPSGVGKTTLAHLLVDSRRRSLALKHVVSTTGSDLFRALAHAADTNSVADLRARHHRCDLLVVDDLDRLAGKAAAQTYLAATIDVLVRRGALVIVTLRQFPAASCVLSEALASRLSEGLVVPLAPPQLLARREIVRQLAGELELRLSDDQIEQIARLASPRKAAPTVPQLRSAVLKVSSAARHEGKSLPPTSVAQLLNVDGPDTKHIVRQIVAAASKQFQVSAADLKGSSRQQAIVEARAFAMCLCRRLTDASFAEVGRHFGGRDHTTVLHACRKIEALASRDPAVSRLLEELTTQVTEASPA